jgi:hypothetical protein
LKSFAVVDPIALSLYQADSKSLKGVPTSDGEIWIYTAGATAPGKIQGAPLVDFNADQQPANFDGTGELILSFYPHIS